MKSSVYGWTKGWKTGRIVQEKVKVFLLFYSRTKKQTRTGISSCRAGWNTSQTKYVGAEFSVSVGGCRPRSSLPAWMETTESDFFFWGGGGGGPGVIRNIGEKKNVPCFTRDAF